MFSQARKAGLDMEALGEQMAQRKAQLLSAYKAGEALPTQMSTMPDQTAP